MFCPNCRKSIPEGTRFCPNCGNPIAFCSNCGNPIAKDAGFCPNCGKPNKYATNESQAKASTVRDSNDCTSGYGFAACLAALVLVGFMPILHVNLYFDSGDYSVIDLMDLAGTLSGYGDFLGVSASSSLSTMLLALWFGLIVCVWAVAIGTSIYGIAKILRGKGVARTGFATYTVFGVLSILTVLVAQFAIYDQSSSYLGSYASSLSSIVSPTIWLWILTIGAIVALVIASRHKSDIGETKDARAPIIMVPSTIARDTGRPLSGADFARHLIGLLWVNLGYAIPFAAASNVLLPSKFTTLAGTAGFEGMTAEVILTSCTSIGVIFALITNVVVGALSDATRSKLGRRKVWMIPGGFIAALGYCMCYFMNSLPLIVAGWSIMQIGINMALAPGLARLSDSIPQKQRGTASALFGLGASAGFALGSIVGSAFIQNQVVGIIILAIWFCLQGVGPAWVTPKEIPPKDWAFAGRRKFWFPIPIENARDFYLALIGRFMVVCGIFMISNFQLFILMNYMGMDDVGGAQTVAMCSIINLFVAGALTLIAGPVSDLLGGIRKIPVLVSTLIIAAGMIIPWVSPTPGAFVGYIVFYSIGYGIYMAVDQALNVDVLPNPDDAGKDLGILNMANTGGQVVGPIITTAVVSATGSYFGIWPIAIVILIAGAVAILFIKNVQ